MADSAAGKELYPELRKALPAQLPAYLTQQRWFGGKARTIRATELLDVIPIALHQEGQYVVLLIVSVEYADGARESYALPMLRPASDSPGAASLRLPGAQGGDQAFVLVDALRNDVFLTTLLNLIQQQTTIRGEKGELRASQTTAYQRYAGVSPQSLHPRPVRAEQSNSSIIYGDQLILKFFRRVEEGINPDLEIGVFLTEKAHFPHTPQVAGSLQYRSRDGKDSAQGILQAFVSNQGDAWSYTLNSLGRFYEKVAGNTLPSDRLGQTSEITEFVQNAAGDYLNSAALLGQRTAEMHAALASDSRDRAFAPEPFTVEFQRELENSMQALIRRVFSQLREKLSGLPEQWRAKAASIEANEAEITNRIQSGLREPMSATRARIHGDYHLGQVLYTGSDFVIIDFEGEPARTLAERRVKRSPLQDVAGMLRSFHYAAFAPLLTPADGKSQTAAELERLGKWAESWNAAVAERFLKRYFETAGAATYLPKSRKETDILLRLHLLEKAVYELGYELNNRPTWLGIPLQGISRLLSA